MTYSLNTPRSRTTSVAEGSPRPGDRVARRSAGRRRRSRRGGVLVPLAFIAPGFLLFLVLIVYPMCRAFQMSFYDWNIVAGATSRFTGWEN